MKRTVIILLITSIVPGIILFSCKKKETMSPTTPVEFIVPAGWPSTTYNFQTNPLTEEGIALGRKLFYDGRLSKDGGYPCSSCHQQKAAFGTFDHDLSHGYNHSHTIRNAPPLQNLAWQQLFNADGSATTLEQVSLNHISTLTEMGETIDGVINKLKVDSAYPSMFKAAFGTADINSSRISKALSQFLITMVSNNSKYDKVKSGQSTFTLAEQTGYDLYKAKCASCHPEPMFTDYSFRNIGMPIDTSIRDYGRMRVTHFSIDSLKFKVPSLRNVDRSFPYGHDGRFMVLDNILEHFRSQVVNGPTTDPLVKNKISMTNFEFGQLKAFMSTLTDSSFITNPSLAE